ncbi:General substrate transporter [Niveomyces insectorum RCEF 264]|uniref:General substrate transporter n=1 Tax=Niveomyces insectorum RCEF 264 TaxID=1081102 RepID=A0A167STJ1_9HYPO|nr:General substrate transporter [Niveomyces insectorum RCEF 264]
MDVSRSPFLKYWKAIKASPPGIYNRRLFLAVFVYALSGTCKGWDEGSASAITQLGSFEREFGITATSGAASNIVSFVNLTGSVGALLSFLLNDRLGRRWSLRLYNVIVIVGQLISTFAYGKLGVLYLGRLVSGLGIGALTVSGPMSIVEVAPPVTRGLMTLMFSVAMLLCQSVGVFVVYGCNHNISAARNLQWQTPFFAQCLVPVLAIVLSFCVSESPRWLCLRGRTEEAYEALAYIRGLRGSGRVGGNGAGDGDPHHLVAEFASISLPIQRELDEYGKDSLVATLREAFTVRTNLRRVQLTIVAYILAQMSGANSVTNYLPTIFGYVGVSTSDTKLYSSGLYAVTKFACCLIASVFFVDAVGRRKSLFIGITIQMLSHTYLGSYLYEVAHRQDGVNKSASNTAIAAIYIHALGWAIAMDKWGAFYFFAAWCLVALIYVFIMVPETSGRSLESMNQLFDHPCAHLRVARPTNDLDALLPFYRDGLGFVELLRFGDHDGFDGVMLGFPKIDQATEGNNQPAQLPQTPYHLEFTTKRGHDAGRAPTQDNLLVFYLPDTSAFQAAVARLTAAGFPPVPAFNPYWDACGKTFEDPDGYRVVLANRASPV